MAELRVLLTEATSASAREVLTVLGRHGHTVDVLHTGGVSLTARSRWVRRRYSSPPFAADPIAYLDRLREVLTSTEYDVVLPTHEQLVALSRFADEFGALAGLAVPPFAAVRVLQDKAAAADLLDRLGLPQPATRLVHSAAELLATDLLPAYIKLPVATSSRGVWLAEDAAQLTEIADLSAVRANFAAGGVVLIQQPLSGSLLLVQAVYDHGRLVGAHTAIRRREGVQGSASAKESVRRPDVIEHLIRLGEELRWHGPLSIDAILDEEDQPRYIDVNPRLVEPVNAELAGAQLVDRWLTVSRGGKPGPLPVAHPGVRTHMLLMAILRHAEVGRGRRAIVRELLAAVRRRGWYAGSTEELLPLREDRIGAAFLIAITACLLISPALWKPLGGSGVPPHTLTPEGWHRLVGRG
ncbi:ATP-grasp domain-containing protein [Kribbella hippodromi]|uniref:ATP-grasp domain-containing protein n=1 Tax=Kribbella hippodromi TaxID=434347 RepID=A0ABN2C5I2_9ACTN